MSYKSVNKIKDLLKIKPVTVDFSQEITRETYWTTYNGSQVKIRHMQDSHLLNIIFHLTERLKKAKISIRESPILKVLKKEAKLRFLKLTKKSLPFLDDNDQWKIWSNEKNSVVDYNSLNKKQISNKKGAVN